MQYRQLGRTGVKVSAIGLGGHEFGQNDFIRGFGDDSKRAVTRGYIFDGFGGENRQRIVEKALDLGINMFDVTIDSEKEAMGRVLKQIGQTDEILIQTRPEGMVYTYDPANVQMGQFDLVKAEVQRICGLLQRDRVDILNFAFMKEAIESDPEYLEKICDIIQRLKREGLIRFASADTFSGEATYLAQYATGAFDTTFINYNVLETAMDDNVIPDAMTRGMGILTREAFMKAKLFRYAENVSEADRGFVAKAGIKWVLRNPAVSCVVVGVASPEQLEENCSCLESLELTTAESELFQSITTSDDFIADLSQKRSAFKGES